MSAGFYERFVRSLLFRLDPETAHHLAINILREASRSSVLLRLVQALAGVGNAAPERKVFGLTFRNPIGLAAGFDKNAVAIPAWQALGFGFVEVGTVTAHAQPGNPRPRIFRYPAEGALINRLGFNNDGAEAIAASLRELRRSGHVTIPIGVNIGKSRITPVTDAAADYLQSFHLLHPFADYIALNVSSPNTPGLRSLQEHEALEELLRAITDANARLAAPKPILLKIAPDLTDQALAEIATACERFGIAGIVATNTTVDHSGITTAAAEAGGLSGMPLRARATKVVRLLRERTRLPIIATGGIADADAASEKFAAGAQLVQVYTGYIYRGPGLLRELAEASCDWPSA